MRQFDEKKFSLTREVKEIFEELKAQGREPEFQQKFWQTPQGVLVRGRLHYQKVEPVKVSLEKRPGDYMENIYIHVRKIQ